MVDVAGISAREFIDAESLVAALARTDPGGIALLDVRAEIEASRGSMPYSVTLPLLSTEERARVGTVYRVEGRERAIALGHEIVSGAVRDNRIEQWTEVIRARGIVALTCARGGLRSKIAQSWLAHRGVILPRVEGGYKALRRVIQNECELRGHASRFLVVGGRTGVGKSRLLDRVARSASSEGGAGVLHLEALAAHRGSAFGSLDREQPSQARFENAVGVALRAAKERNRSLLLVESESRMIGQCLVPRMVSEVILTAPRIVIDEPVESRVGEIIDEYIERSCGEVAKGTPMWEERTLVLEKRYERAIHRIAQKLGSERATTCASLLTEAFRRYREDGASHHHGSWVRFILTVYYDPLYDRHSVRCADQILFHGTGEAAYEWIMSQVG